MIAKSVPRAIKEQLWIKAFGHVFENKCSISWCRNNITVFNFEVGHNIPKSKGGSNSLTNLVPICTRCNRSMSNIYTIDAWNRLL